MGRKNHNLWITGILLMAGTVLLFTCGPNVHSPRALTHFWNLGHLIYFALLAVLLIQWKPVSRLPLMWQWAIILSVTLLAGTAIEFLQYGTSRTPDAADIFRDLTGSLLVLVFRLPAKKLRPNNLLLALRVFTVLLTLAQLWPLTNSLVDDAIAQHQFPVLADFETPFEIKRWKQRDRISIGTLNHYSEDKLLKLSMTTDLYSGTALQYFNGDWRSFRSLRFSLYNPDNEPIKITCRIHDLEHTSGNQEFEDRFNRSYVLTPGWNHIQIDLEEVKNSPAGREMDMSQIKGVGIFAVSLPSPRTIYIDDVRLSS